LERTILTKQRFLVKPIYVTLGIFLTLIVGFAGFGLGTLFGRSIHTDQAIEGFSILNHRDIGGVPVTSGEGLIDIGFQGRDLVDIASFGNGQSVRIYNQEGRIVAQCDWGEGRNYTIFVQLDGRRIFTVYTDVDGAIVDENFEGVLDAKSSEWGQ